MKFLGGSKAMVVNMLVITLISSGCAGVGPGTVARDRFDYVTAISNSWKRQTLLNLVKTRYVDAPVFMDVTSVINQYSLEGEVNLAASWVNSPGLDSQSLGGTAKYADRPTITYSPLMGEKFTRSFMTPIPVAGILFLLQSGYAADRVLRLCVHTINGIENSYGSSTVDRPADPRFLELITALRNIQKAGGLGMRVRNVDEKQAFIIFFRTVTDPDLAENIRKVRELLGIDPKVRDLKVVYGSHAENNREIAIHSRSMLQVSVDLAAHIEVPEKDFAEGRVYLPQHQSGAETAMPPLLRIRYSVEQPTDAHVAVPYRGGWFWIDDRDFPSKQTFFSYMLLSSLTETGAQSAAPIVTVPAN
jgi:hypothetical protein